MQVKEVIERALYLSIKDRYFNALPEDPVERDVVLTEFLGDFNRVLMGVGKKNPAYSTYDVNTDSLSFDEKLNMTYVDLSSSPFLTLFRVEFLYSGGTSSITLNRLGINDFFSNSDLRTLYTFPAFYNYNVFSKKLYIYPKPSVFGTINLFGKQAIGSGENGFFESIDEEFPDFVSNTFLIYLEYFFAKYICSNFNAPWQAQKEELLKNYGRLVDSENNIAYQELSLNEGQFSVPIRNTRIGL